MPRHDADLGRRLLDAKASLSRRLLAPDPGTVRAQALSRSGSADPAVNVLAVGIGLKEVGGRTTSDAAIKIFVRRKHPAGAVGEDFMLPESVDGMPTDVEEIGLVQPLAVPDPRERYRPVRPGSSMGAAEGDPALSIAGTVGALVMDRQGRYLLSNNHVLADQNRLPFGTPILGPSPLDGGTPAQDAIARLEGYVPLDFAGPNYVDGAIARLDDPQAATPDILQIGPPSGSAQAELHMMVEKFGRTTGFTVGYVVSVSTDVKIPYDVGTALFADQIAIKPIAAGGFSDQGDSGALVLDRRTGLAVGLLFAGSATISFANHIGDVLDAFGIDLVVT